MACIAVTKPCSAQVRERAQALGCTPIVVSFEPLPRAYFSKEPVPRLSSVREKLLGFAAAGMEHTLLLRFNRALTAMSAEDFIQRVLIDRLGVREVWVGADFRFGHKRTGDVAMLERDRRRARVRRAYDAGGDCWMASASLPAGCGTAGGRRILALLRRCWAAPS